MVEKILIYKKSEVKGTKEISLPLSKSIGARHLMLSAICKRNVFSLGEHVESLPRDLIDLVKALKDFDEGKTVINVAESGTAMRFMLSYISVHTQRKIRLEGTGRQHERPIKPLVDALLQLGCNITYLEKTGYPPLLIEPTEIAPKPIKLDASKSSQYLSSLLLLAPLIEDKAFSIEPIGGMIASRPYIDITIEILREYGFHWQYIDGVFRVASIPENHLNINNLQLEGDWSAASYFYMLQRLHPAESIQLKNLIIPSLQGDSKLLIKLYLDLGVITTEVENGIRLSLGKGRNTTEAIVVSCNQQPDLVPALVATFIGLNQRFRIEGIAHLRLKESDRIAALTTEISKLGIDLKANEDSLEWDGQSSQRLITEPFKLSTYQDHRIAMALAPLMASRNKLGVIIDNPECVSKSFPSYWAEIEKLGYTLKQTNI
ncbi:MAG: 3-phosphoshikimate 1-carboxyvinyltransferase [Porphyromonas sp.]